MPLLPREPQIEPEEIFSLDEPWRVAHVRSRQEKALARYAHEHRIAFYLPQIEKQTERSGRRFSSYLPLFPGYFFFRGDAVARDRVMRSDLAVSIIDVADQEILGRELGQIRELQLAGASLMPVETFAAGDAVRVSEGAFAGYEGVVARSGRSERLIVSISLLRKSIAVELDRGVLRRPRGR
jgi:transcriptional antiterminator RfaH